MPGNAELEQARQRLLGYHVEKQDLGEVMGLREYEVKLNSYDMIHAGPLKQARGEMRQTHLLNELHDLRAQHEKLQQKIDTINKESIRAGRNVLPAPAVSNSPVYQTNLAAYNYNSSSVPTQSMTWSTASDFPSLPATENQQEQHPFGHAGHTAKQKYTHQSQVPLESPFEPLTRPMFVTNFNPAGYQFSDAAARPHNNQLFTTAHSALSDLRTQLNASPTSAFDTKPNTSKQTSLGRGRQPARTAKQPASSKMSDLASSPIRRSNRLSTKRRKNYAESSEDEIPDSPLPANNKSTRNSAGMRGDIKQGKRRRMSKTENSSDYSEAEAGDTDTAQDGLWSENDPDDDDLVAETAILESATRKRSGGRNSGKRVAPAPNMGATSGRSVKLTAPRQLAGQKIPMVVDEARIRAQLEHLEALRSYVNLPKVEVATALPNMQHGIAGPAPSSRIQYSQARIVPTGHAQQQFALAQSVMPAPRLPSEAMQRSILAPANIFNTVRPPGHYAATLPAHSSLFWPQPGRNNPAARLQYEGDGQMMPAAYTASARTQIQQPRELFGSSSLASQYIHDFDPEEEAKRAFEELGLEGYL